MTNTITTRPWTTEEFAVLTARPFPSIDRPTYFVTGHGSESCPRITDPTIATGKSLADFMDENDHFDGEIDYLAPWPCGTCVTVNGFVPTIEFEARRDLPTQGAGTTATARPIPQASPLTDEAIAYAKGYAGTLAFMLDMRVRANKGFTFTPKMVAAILRCKSADAARPAAPQAGAPATDEDTRRIALQSNSYAGTCRSCGGHVPAGAGRREKLDGRWTVLHTSTTECVPAATVPVEAPRTPQVALPEVPEGHYAVDTDKGHLAFYRVDVPTEGRWVGRTFLSVQASDDYHPVRGTAVAPILVKIAADPQAAMLRYGVEIGRCGHCNRTLTDETSRALGIGPVCRKGLGW